MKFKRIVFEFESEPSEFALGVFWGNVDKYRDEADKMLADTIKKYETSPVMKLMARWPGNKVLYENATSQLKLMRSRLPDFFRWRHEGKTITVEWPAETTLAAKLPGLLKKETVAPELFIKWFKDNVFPETTWSGYKGMGVKLVKATVADVDGD